MLVAESALLSFTRDAIVGILLIILAITAAIRPFPILFIPTAILFLLTITITVAIAILILITVLIPISISILTLLLPDRVTILVKLFAFLLFLPLLIFLKHILFDTF